MENDTLRGDQNLEDGEFWLPNDFFSMDDNKYFSTKTTSTTTVSTSASMQGSSVSSERFPPLQGYKSALLYGTSGADAGVNCIGRAPINQFRPLNPFRDQVENIMGGQTQPVQNGFDPNPIGGGSGPKSSGCRGTGVFLPQVPSEVIAAAKSRNSRFARKSVKGKIPPRKALPEQRTEDRKGDATAASDQVQFRKSWIH